MCVCPSLCACVCVHVRLSLYSCAHVHVDMRVCTHTRIHIYTNIIDWVRKEVRGAAGGGGSCGRGNGSKPTFS